MIRIKDIQERVMMKRIILLFYSILSIVFFVACGGKDLTEDVISNQG